MSCHRRHAQRTQVPVARVRRMDYGIRCTGAWHERRIRTSTSTTITLACASAG
jgi:hypothetical protein